MNKSIVLAAVFVLSACGREIPPEQKQEALAIFDQFQSSLLSELKRAMDAGGPAAAIGICQTASPAVEKKFSDAWEVRRVSNRPRNPSHVPDAFESRVIEKWIQEGKAGKKPEPVAAIDQGKVRVMRPIMIASDTCLRCHGMPENLDAAALTEIKRLYPADQATGYKIGDLRGAFSAVRRP